MSRSLLLSALRPCAVFHEAAGLTTPRAARIIRPSVPDVCCTPERRLPRRSRRPRSTPGQTGPSTRHAPPVTGESATGLSATGARIVVHYDPVMMRECALSVRLSRFILHRVIRLRPLREPRKVPIFDLGLVCRSTFGCVFPIGANFGWAVARCGRYQIRADKGGQEWLLAR